MARSMTALLTSAALLLVFVPAASAAPPSNDEMATPIVITSVPATITLDTTEATSSDSDPGYCFGPELGPDPATVWFSYTPTVSGPLAATTFGSDYDTTLYVGTVADGEFEQIACSDDTRTLQAGLRFDATAGVTYYFVAATSPFAGVNGGNLVFNLDVGLPAQEVAVTLDPIGTITKDGVLFTGTVSCTAPTTFQSLVIVELDQNEGDKKAVDYIGFVDIADCPGTDIAFEILLQPQVGKVKKGDVTLEVIFAACNDLECDSVVIEGLAGTVVKK